MPDSSRELPRRPSTTRPVAFGRVLESAAIAATQVRGRLLSREVTGITHDSRQVREGDVYAALPGAVTHGARFASDAVAAGAVVVLTDPEGAELIPASAGAVVVTPDPRGGLGRVAAEIYGHPARDLLMIGVTGTNGKTTTAYLADAGLRAAGHTTGLVGTVETRIGELRAPSVRTTPESPDLHALLAVMRERGVTACAMEVSSHALVFGRVDGVVFDVAGFTNLSQDHLDFHADLEDYFAAKAGLFTPERARRGVACSADENADDHGQRIVAGSAIPVVPVYTRPQATRSHAWNVTEPRLQPSGLPHARLISPGGADLSLDVPLPGDFNVSNAALAVAMLVEAGVAAPVAAQGVAACEGVPGRMQRIEAPGAADDAPLALLDYAHTPDAVHNVLCALPRRGRVIVVLGAGGDRDRQKRPLMGAAAAEAADVLIVTDDNPRSEDPAEIRGAVIAGTARVPSGSRAEVRDVPGRREAIRMAVGLAHGPADVVVVLGKGHEQGQEIAGTVHPFDDAAVLREELTR